MDVLFLGGASGVGASCIALQVGARWILVDVGVRMDRSADRLPDLAMLDGKDVAAIFITHAHADHIGALPLAHQSFPQVPIYTSLATMRLMEVMLADAVRIMSRRAADELEIPLFDAELVDSMLRCVRVLPLDGISRVPELPEVAIHTVRAGHVAGAMMLGFEAPNGRVLISGDVSLTPQRTIRGAAMPTLKHPDLLILESTYGARLHPNRQAEEQRLARSVAKHLEQGHVLIPAFALGRAQEVLMILRAAQKNRDIPPFEIWIDGLVRSVCAAYAAFPHALQPSFARHLERGGRPFLSRTIRAIESPAQRKAILNGRPSCIITSSGMLTGGPSAWFASRLAEDTRAAILLTGYQDEEAPGGKLQAAAASGGGTIELEGQAVTLSCAVGTYGLSAHADGDELASLVRSIQPHTTALVHGDERARTALGARINTMTNVVFPTDGSVLTITASSRRRSPGGKIVPDRLTRIGDGGPLSLERVWRHFDDGSGLQTVSVRDLVRVWWGDEAHQSAEAEVAAALAGSQPYFASIANLDGMYRVRSAADIQHMEVGGGPATVSTTSRPDQMALLALVQHYLGDAPDLYHRGVHGETGAINLAFYFPDRARRRYAAAIQALQAAAGVPVDISSQAHQGALGQAAVSVLPETLRLARNPSVHVDQQTVTIRCSGTAAPEAIEAAKTRFHEQTGWQLDVVMRGSADSARTNHGRSAHHQNQRLEYNAALAVAYALFPVTTGCYKISADQANGVLILRFNFPIPAQQRYATQIAELAERTGWQVRIHAAEHQGALDGEARQVLPDQTMLVGVPSLRHGQNEVVVRYRGSLEPQEVESVTARFRETTGWNLQLQPAESLG